MDCPLLECESTTGPALKDTELSVFNSFLSVHLTFNLIWVFSRFSRVCCVFNSFLFCDRIKQCVICRGAHIPNLTFFLSDFSNIDLLYLMIWCQTNAIFGLHFFYFYLFGFTFLYLSARFSIKGPMTSRVSHTLTAVGNCSLITVSHWYAGLNWNKRPLLFCRWGHKGGICEGDVEGVGGVCTSGLVSVLYNSVVTECNVWVIRRQGMCVAKVLMVISLDFSYCAFWLLKVLTEKSEDVVVKMSHPHLTTWLLHRLLPRFSVWRIRHQLPQVKARLQISRCVWWAQTPQTDFIQSEDIKHVSAWLCCVLKDL